jgi:DNA invertase Pin-like site-specific DNA recombinase
VIAYLRVSTKRQGISGLGLDAQRAAIRAYAERIGEPIHDEVVEVETGTSKRERPGLARAILLAKSLRTRIVTAKLDRLARDVAAVVALQQAGVGFLALDLPDTENPLFLYMIAALAEYEATLISQRTKAALAAAKARGVKIGNPERFTDEGRRAGGEVLRGRARRAHAQVEPFVIELRSQGLSTNRIAQRLNESGLRTPGGCPYSARTIGRMLKRGELQDVVE